MFYIGQKVTMISDHPWTSVDEVEQTWTPHFGEVYTIVGIHSGFGGLIFPECLTRCFAKVSFRPVVESRKELPECLTCFLKEPVAA